MAFVHGDRISDLSGGSYGDLRSWLGGNDGVETAKSIAAVSVSEVVWRPVIPNPDKILCVGLNFLDNTFARLEEGRGLSADFLAAHFYAGGAFAADYSASSFGEP